MIIIKGFCPLLGLAAMCLWGGKAIGQDSEDAIAGQALFETYQCWQCHSYQGQGGAHGPRIAPTLYPFEIFSQFVRRTNLMPAYSPNVLSDQDLRLIYEYVSSIPEPPPLEDIPKLTF
jgi:mono/diheme cytochrome c family protein